MGVAKILRMTQGKVESRCVIHYDSDVQRTVAKRHIAQTSWA